MGSSNESLQKSMNASSNCMMSSLDAFTTGFMSSAGTGASGSFTPSSAMETCEVSILFLGLLRRLLDFLDTDSDGGGTVFSRSVSKRVETSGAIAGVESRKPEEENWTQSLPMASGETGVPGAGSDEACLC